MTCAGAAVDVGILVARGRASQPKMSTVGLITFSMDSGTSVRSVMSSTLRIHRIARFIFVKLGAIYTGSMKMFDLVMLVAALPFRIFTMMRSPF